MVLVEPPVDWTLKGAARADAIEAYLDKFGELTVASEFSRDLRNQVRSRLELRLDEYPKGLQSYSKYLDKGVDSNVYIEKQGLDKNFMPNNEPPWKARVGLDSIPAGGAGNPERRVFHREMAPPGTTDFRVITSDVDFVGFFNLDGSIVEDVMVRLQIYETLRHSLGMQHGESLSYTMNEAAKEGWLSGDGADRGAGGTGRVTR